MIPRSSDARRRVDPRRTRPLNDRPAGPGPVLYWMQRDQRPTDNWALLHAVEEADERGVPAAVVFCLTGAFLGAASRQYAFMAGGLAETAAALAETGIPFFLLSGDPAAEVPRFAASVDAGMVVADFNPLRPVARWKAAAAAALPVTLREVDAHNIVPAWIASPKREYAARTLRPKIHRLLPSFLTGFPKTTTPHRAWKGRPPVPDVREALRRLGTDPLPGPVPRIEPGPRAALLALRRFAAGPLERYRDERNNPAVAGQSGLSPYLHFGHLAPQRAAIAVEETAGAGPAVEAFLEELIVRRELADNFCLYEPRYDSAAAFPAWAAATLAAHRGDPREYRYAAAVLEAGETHDGIWNAAQREMTERGTMHGYLRMYWAKKILEWTGSPEEAVSVAVSLNDRYQLDGRDPNGYAGIAWAIGGVHDRPWFERDVFGTVRYMSAGGCRAKFDTAAYIARVAGPG